MTNMFPEIGEVIEQGHRAQALELAVQLHVARARTGHLTETGDECLSLDTIDTAKMFEAYLRGDEVQEEPTS